MSSAPDLSCGQQRSLLIDARDEIFGALVVINQLGAIKNKSPQAHRLVVLLQRLVEATGYAPNFPNGYPMGENR